MTGLRSLLRQRIRSRRDIRPHRTTARDSDFLRVTQCADELIVVRTFIKHRIVEESWSRNGAEDGQNHDNEHNFDKRVTVATRPWRSQWRRLMRRLLCAHRLTTADIHAD